MERYPVHVVFQHTHIYHHKYVWSKSTLKIAVFWHVSPCGLVDTVWVWIALIARTMKAVSSSKISTRLHDDPTIPDDNLLRTRHHENLKPHFFLFYTQWNKSHTKHRFNTHGSMLTVTIQDLQNKDAVYEISRAISICGNRKLSGECAVYNTSVWELKTSHNKF